MLVCVECNCSQIYQNAVLAVLTERGVLLAGRPVFCLGITYADEVLG